MSYKNEKLSLSDKPDDYCVVKVDDVEEEFERLDTTEIINITMMFEKNKDAPKDAMQITKDMLVSCPELNFYTDHVLNGTMHQIASDTHWFASAD